MSIPQLSEADLTLLRKYDTPTICNVIEVFKVRSQTEGYMDGRIRACFPEMPPMVGYASTATFRSAAPPASGNVYASLDAQVEGFAKLPQPVVVVVQDLASRGMVEHAAQGSAIHDAGMDAEADDPPRALVHDHQHPMASQDR